jgi:hypothetical protein
MKVEMLFRFTPLLAILIAILAATDLQAKEIKIGCFGAPTLIVLTGKLGSYTDKEDGSVVTITTNDVAILPTDCSPNLPTSLPIKNVAVINAGDFKGSNCINPGLA